MPACWRPRCTQGEPTEGYWRPEHPVQVRIAARAGGPDRLPDRPRRARHRRLLGAELGDPAHRPRPRLRPPGDARARGPTFVGLRRNDVMPAKRSAERASTRKRRAWSDRERARPAGASARHAGRIPIWSRDPAGSTREVMTRLPGQVLLKSRRRGRLLRRAAGARPGLRHQDRRRRQAGGRGRGARSSSPVSIPTAEGLGPPSRLLNWRGVEVGQMRPTQSLQQALDALR